MRCSRFNSSSPIPVSHFHYIEVVVPRRIVFARRRRWRTGTPMYFAAFRGESLRRSVGAGVRTRC
ncbi:hypothetical protein SAMN04487894_101596 [Niabella drilacis]|uniref:Uncharacterized protein n=1 Tax=Niabella drilacis (strain DSM 25811 / CCM 8410 / CCUG 62505 / LMG 26954 / E90) TaxID=1285928 RepID=A0A1G6JPZ4_NIADE|nr:hypothetical protein SAMN04487894_101596 [Niabella drilacis]